MKRLLIIIVFSLWNQSSFSETSPLIIISDEFGSKGDISTTINSSLYINNKVNYYKINSNHVSNNNSEDFNYLAITPSIRYGVNNNLLLVSSITGSYSRYSAISQDGKDVSTSDSNLDAFSFGFLYKIKDESSWNKVLGFNTNIYERFNTSKNYFKTINGRFMLDKIYDPLVFSLDSGFNYSKNIDIDGNNYKPSNFIYVKPKIDFLANNFFSFGLGTDIKIRSNEKINNYIINNNLIENNIFLSLSHTLNNKNRIYFETSFNTSGNSGGVVSFSLDMDH